jgi:hypothetical protein
MASASSAVKKHSDSGNDASAILTDTFATDSFADGSTLTASQGILFPTVVTPPAWLGEPGRRRWCLPTCSASRVQERPAMTLNGTADDDLLLRGSVATIP